VKQKVTSTTSKFYRNTRQRQVILEELKSLTSHPSAADLYEIVRRHLPKISLGTVYRNLELLTQMGLIQKLQISGSLARYDGNLTYHSHIRCVRCHQVGDLDEMSYDPGRSGPRELDGYVILGCRVEFFGVCPECRKGNTRKGDR